MGNSHDELEALKAQVVALTARIYMLEQRLGISAPAPPRPAAPAPAAPATGEPIQPIQTATVPSESRTPPPAELPPFMTAARTTKPEISLEKKIGQVWLNRIGIAAVLGGVAFFLQWAFENNLIGAGGRVAIGLVGGILLVLWSERFRRKNYLPFSYSLKAVGIGSLYLSLWAAGPGSRVFETPVISSVEVVFAAMVVVTASTIAMALAQDAQLLALFSLIGGFSTPVLVSTGQNREIVLFSYVAILDLAVLVIAIFKPWRRLLWISFAGTVILYCGWAIDYYSTSQRPVTVFFTILFAAIFASIPLVTPFERSTRFKGPSITLIVLPLLNAVAFFLALYAMYESEKDTLTWYALGLAAGYLALSNAFKRRVTQEEGKVINLIHVAIAIAFITIAIPLKLNRHWITMGWLVESAVLLWIGVTTRTKFLRYMAVAALVLGIARLLLFPISHDHLIFNARFATYLVAIAVLGGIVYFGGRSASEKEQIFVKVAAVVLNLLALTALTLEAGDYFDRMRASAYNVSGYSDTYQQIELKQNFSYSAIWILYGAALMAIGFWKKTAFVRWQALVLIAATIVKVFAYDSQYLNQGYRILSFIALGVVLLAVSFFYFKASSRGAEKSSPESPV